MKRAALLLLVLVLGACQAKRGGLPSDVLDQAIGSEIGDPTTCVIIAERTTGRTLYSYNAGFDCVRALPACDRPGFLSAKQALALAAAPGGRDASCNSTPDGSRTIGWAEGRVTSVKGRDLVYSAVMEGQRALPGHEMAARLADVFANAGL